MPDSLATLVDQLAAHQVVNSILLILVVVALRSLVVRVLRGSSDFLSEQQRRRVYRTKWLSWVFLAVVLFLIWAPTLQSMALSLTAFAVAIVIATKELILCVSGSLMRSGGHSFSVGDWIRVGEASGEVIDQNFLSTTLEELDLGHNRYGFTGRTVVLPNSLFLTTPVTNCNFMKRYVFHRFELVFDGAVDLLHLKRIAREILDDEFSRFAEIARRYNQMIERRAGVDLPSPEPTVEFATTDFGKLRLIGSLFCPTGEAERIEQRAIEALLAAGFAGSSGAATPRAARG